MSSIILPRRFTQQPQYPVELDLTSPLLAGSRAVYVAVFNGKLLNANRFIGPGLQYLSTNPQGETWTNNGSPILTANNGAVGTSYNSSSSQLSSVSPFGDFSNGEKFTSCLLHTKTASGNTVSAGKTITTAGSGRDFIHYSVGNDAYFYVNNPGVSVAGKIPVGVLVAAVGTYDGTNINYYVGKSAATPASLSYINQSFPIAYNRWGANTYQHDIFQHIVLAGKALSRREAESWQDNPWQIFKRRPQVLYFDVGGGGTTGTGSLTTATETISGTGVIGHTGTGALTASEATISGTGVISHTGTGSLTTSEATLSGSGVITHTGTGSLTTSEATLSGDGTVTGAGEQTGTGALTLNAVTASGSGVITHKGTGTLTTSDATLSGAGVLTHNGTGTLTTSEATLDGTGNVLGEITGTGALTTGEVTVSGYDVIPVAEKPSGGGGTSTSVVSGRRKKQKLILVERVEDVEELIEQIDEIVEQSPKTKVRAKVQKPTHTVQEAPQAAFDWLAYYDAQLSRFRDQQRANSLRLQLDRNAEIIRAIIDGQQNAQQQAQMLQMQQDEEDLLLLLMAA